MQLETIGSTPANEDCVQVGKDNYIPAMRKECRWYAALLRLAHPAPDGCELRVTSFPHDFGSYLEVVAYGPDSEDSWNWVNVLDTHKDWTPLVDAARANCTEAEWLEFRNTFTALNP
jgi:hypothetical protein